MTTLQRMTAQEFDEQKHKLRGMSTQNNELARLVLVDGLTHTKAAEVLGMLPQNVSGAMNRIKALLEDMPADYVFLQAWMPKKKAAEIRAYLKEEEAKRQAKNKSNINK
jgi:hypothetical protein